MRTAIYAGSFDPLTNGHLWMIEKGLELFEHLYVAIGSNPSKNHTFSLKSRLELLEKSISPCKRLSITHFTNNYLVDYAKSVQAQYILRGIRSPNDYEYEKVMRHINADIAPDITTVLLIPPRDISELSSSMIKSLVGPDGWEDHVKRYVPDDVMQALKKMNKQMLKKHHEKGSQVDPTT